MKKTLVSLMVLALFCAKTSYAQIYIDTGNPESEDMKQDNPVKSIYVPAEENSNKIENNNKYINTESETPSKAVKTTSTGVISTGTAYSGNLNPANDDLPPFAEPGKCYARCFIPDQYEFVENQVLDKPASFKTQVIPATFETVFDTVVISPEKVSIEVVPAVYETVTEEIMVAPATTRWEKGKGDANCLSSDPRDCQVLCLKEIPAQFNKVDRKVVKTPSYTRQIISPSEIKIVPRQVMVKPAQTIQLEIPATYKKILDKQLVKKGGYTDWREVLCGEKLTNDRIRQIQLALIAKGYNVGPRGADNVFGADTKNALVKYQADNSLPQGNLNMETLNSLGVK